MSSVFHGEIVVPGDAGDGLAASIVLDNGNMTLSTGDEVLGSWDVPDYHVRRGENGGFRLSLGGEDLLFWPELPKSFAEEVGAPVKAQPTQLPPVTPEGAVPTEPPPVVEPSPAPGEPPSGVNDEADGTPDEVVASVRPQTQLEDEDEFITPVFLKAVLAVAAVIVVVALLAIVVL